MKRSKRPSLQEVAKEAGVAVMTASRAMRGEPSVRPHLAARVSRAAAKLGYRPNLMARGLRSQRSDFVTIDISQLSNPYFGSLAEELTRSLAGTGLRLLLCHGMEDMLAARSGLAACATVLVNPADSAVESLASSGAPLVTISRGPDCPDVAPDVSPDLDSAYREATALALSDGRERFAYVCPKEVLRRNYQKKFTVIDATLRSHGLEPCKNVHHTSQDVAEMLRSDRTAADVIFCENDPLAVQVLVRLRALGLRCPEDVMVFGCDGTALVPGLWTVQHDPREISLTVAGLVKRLIAGEKLTGQWLIRPKVVLGE